jgi:multidrug resistance protein MdtO
VLNWPGIHTCLITCYIVALGNMAETVEKLALRIVGAAIGGGLGIAAIVYLMPHVTSIAALLAVVFLGSLGAAWIAVGSERIAYIGFQMAFAFFLCVIQGPAPAFDMTTMRDRLIGILIGNVAVYLIFAHMWPVSIAQRVDSALAGLLRRLAELCSTSGLAQRRQSADEILVGLHGAKEDIERAAYEPPSVRPTLHWLGLRESVFRELLTLVGPILLSRPGEPVVQTASERLERLAATTLNGGQKSRPSAIGTSASAVYPQGRNDEALSQSLARLIDTPLSALEELFQLPIEQGRAIVYVPA